MTNQPLIECVPNFSEGVNSSVIQRISSTIQNVKGVRLLNVDPGKATNRTVITFVGSPQKVVDAAFEAIKVASELIDMSNHTGEHPRMGATDVCPLIPISGITMEEVVKFAHALAKKVGEQLDIPVFMYEEAATSIDRKNLSVIRSGEYEGLEKKLKVPKWLPDYGPTQFNAKSGATVIGARDFLVAYNVNLNTTSSRKANAVAFDVRENGRIKREGNAVTGNIIRDEKGKPIRIPGSCKFLKAIGWYIDEYRIAQVSMNLTNLKITSMHHAFEACCESARSRGLRVTGSELVGLVPKKILLDAGKYFLTKQQRSLGISEDEIIHIAIKSMGLDELAPFLPKERIIEYMLEELDSSPLIQLSLSSFSEITASESVTPGGGSVAAYLGALGASLAAMVANLSANKRGWDERWSEFSSLATSGQELKNKLLKLVDEDTHAFNAIIHAMRLPSNTNEDKLKKKQLMDIAIKQAISVPLSVMEIACKSMPLLLHLAEIGNPNSVSDAGVGGLCAMSAIKGAYYNVLINCKDINDPVFVKTSLNKAETLLREAETSSHKLEAIMKNHLEN